MSEKNKNIVLKFLETYNRNALDELDNLMSADYVHHNNDVHFNLNQFKRGAGWMRKGMPDFVLQAEDVLADGDKVILRWVGRGTHLGSFNGETPTSKTVTLYGISIYRIENGLIAEDWEAMDEASFNQQISPTAQ